MSIQEMAEDIIDNNEIYQTLYRTTECRQELLDDDELWEKVVSRVIFHLSSEFNALICIADSKH